MVVVLRFISKDWELQQRLVRLHMLAKSMTGENRMGTDKYSLCPVQHPFQLPYCCYERSCIHEWGSHENFPNCVPHSS